MIRITLYIFSILFLCLGCNYNVTPSNGLNSKTLVGNWQWLESSGGIMGTTTTPASSGYTKTILFTSEGKYEAYKNGQKSQTDTYEIIEDKSIFSGELSKMIKYNDGSIKQSFNLKGPDSLYLYEECYDCYTHIFIRKK